MTGRVVGAETVRVTTVVLIGIVGRVARVVVGTGGLVVVGVGGRVVGTGVGVSSGTGSGLGSGLGCSCSGGGGGGMSMTGSGSVVGGCVSSCSRTSTVNSINSMGISSSGWRQPPMKPLTKDAVIRPIKATMCPISDSFIPELLAADFIVRFF